MIDVVAGIIWKNDKILIARRSKNKHLPYKWEFPGGKIESGESAEKALERELKEELGIHTKTNDFFSNNIHQYEAITINLYAYNSIYLSGDITLIDHDQVEWVSTSKLLDYDFADADLPFVYKLVNL
ncbi:(deoxy)nucleoside triphosphate pyrophosphohydrolase [Cytophagaceae bacterium DM2B3-1]|uniref:8-oxo-dGTP diphosphatase n=1 Tax=Xanthocytophaga flava TaxID=3048013 RepID=A0ABT7CXH0_9BACT|nr:(deoxy)nucleoside triphosphate pyrophosphohydrolase [Xanthocytophaga flavus]MDJ1497632.1 (deoxy)nucleoside triphosphate pyrophosphohydrolase [Xanthocytophaga flavus]